MSLFSALQAAVTGLSTQSAAMGNISDNLSNTSTIGYKRVDTAFESLVTDSNSNFNDPGGVSAKPVYQNTLQGDLQTNSSSTALAISGDGFFAVRRASANTTGSLTFQNEDYYTRKGDFTLNKDGYLVNGSGYYLLGYNVDETTGNANTALVNPIQISAVLDNPVATNTIEYSANLPAGAQPASTYPTSSIQIYDSLGNTHTLNITWTKDSGSNQWTMRANVADSIIPFNRSLDFEFSGTQSGTLSSLNSTQTIGSSIITNLSASASGSTLTLGNGNWADNGYRVGDTVTVAGSGVGADNVTYTITAMTNGVATVTPAPAADMTADTAATLTRSNPGIAASSVGGQTGSAFTINPPVPPSTAATISFDIQFPGATSQTVTMNLGDYNKSTGITQFADTTLQTTTLEQNGIPRGSFQSVSISSSGLVSLNFDNGRSRALFQIPVVQFNSPNNLQRVDGNAYARTLESGTPRYSQAGTIGAGTIAGNSLETSNVDIADEFTKMIQSQRVYQANAKTITTTDSMLEEVINVIR